MHQGKDAWINRYTIVEYNKERSITAWNPVLVTKTLIAPTITVLTAVLLNKDLLEKVQFVKVFECKGLSTASSSQLIQIIISRFTWK